jgi:hypothetical protein
VISYCVPDGGILVIIHSEATARGLAHRRELEHRPAPGGALGGVDVDLVHAADDPGAEAALMPDKGAKNVAEEHDRGIGMGETQRL